MNLWGFTAKAFEILGNEFLSFLKLDKTNYIDDELCLSTAIDSTIKKGLCSMPVLPTDAKWYGVTYQQDKEHVVSSISELVKN